ncbi:hypothetical protein [Coprobacter tertius]|uniref:Lipoprotein n=1 Tax=Coprobacter tertius TaxID=2944915 RepID=A0ABT1MGI6_9BACT|nr:hypothetical protein [Coprobacter tertius]MCP9611740.1 hypothetical protein [Coprobacter tertius]
MILLKYFNVGIGLLTISIFISGCGNIKKNNIETNKNDSITVLLTRQLNAGYYASGAGDIMLYDIDLPDFKITEQLILDSLEKRGFIVPTDSSFLKRIKTIFGIEVKIGEIIHLHTRNNDEDVVYNPQNPFGIGDVIHIDADKNIVSKTCYLPDIIDYKISFPDLAKSEKNIDSQQILNNKFNGEENDWDVHLWNEKKYSDFDLKWLFHINQYISYDNLTSFIWLSENVPDILKNLLLTFSYDKDDRINKLVLDDNNISLIDKFIGRDKHGTLKIQEGVLHTVEQLSTPDCNKYFEMTSSLVDLMAYHPDTERDKQNTYPSFNDLTLQERHHIIAYAVNTLQPLYEKYNGEDGYGNLDQFNIGIVDCFWNAFFDDHKLLYDIETNNCYNLPNLTKLIQKMRQDDRLINGKNGSLEPWNWSPEKYLEE